MDIVVTPSPVGWMLNGSNHGAAGCHEILPAPGVGISHVLDIIAIHTGEDNAIVAIGQGKSGAVGELTLIGPIAMAANTSRIFPFRNGLVLEANKELTVDVSGTICLFVQGRTQEQEAPACRGCGRGGSATGHQALPASSGG